MSAGATRQSASSASSPAGLRAWLKLRAYPMYPRAQRTGVLMWHHGRCGSSVLGRMLRAHPALRWHGELFNPFVERGVARPQWRSDVRLAQLDDGDRRTGIELKGLPPQHLPTLGVDLAGFVAALQADGFDQAIFLDRTNTLRKLISVQIVDQGLRAGYHMPKGKEQPLEGQLRLDLQRVRIQGREAPLMDMLQYVHDETRKAHAVMTRHFPAMLSITYEAHIESDPRVAYRLVLEHLGLEHVDADVTLSRINTRSIADLVANHAEVAAELADTPFAWMLSD